MASRSVDGNCETLCDQKTDGLGKKGRFGIEKRESVDAVGVGRLAVTSVSIVFHACDLAGRTLGTFP